MSKKGSANLHKETYTASIPVREMIIGEYQGHVHQGLVEKIANNWDTSAAGSVVLNMREDDTYAVLDGQHRMLAATAAGVQELNAMVYVGKTLEEEARLFVLLNTKHNVSAMDRFRANLVSGRTLEKNVSSILREVGLHIALTGPDKEGKAIQCPSVLTKIYEQFGPTHMRTVAGVLTAAFDSYPDRAKGYCGPAWYAASQIVYRYPQVDVKRLIQRLKEKSPTVMQGMAEMYKKPGQETWVGWAKVFVERYNHGARTSALGYLSSVILDKKVYTPGGKAATKNSKVVSLTKARAANRAKAQERKAAKAAGSRA